MHAKINPNELHSDGMKLILVNKYALKAEEQLTLISTSVIRLFSTIWNLSGWIFFLSCASCLMSLLLAGAAVATADCSKLQVQQKKIFKI